MNLKSKILTVKLNNHISKTSQNLSLIND